MCIKFYLELSDKEVEEAVGSGDLRWTGEPLRGKIFKLYVFIIG